MTASAIQESPTSIPTHSKSVVGLPIKLRGHQISLHDNKYQVQLFWMRSSGQEEFSTISAPWRNLHLPMAFYMIVYLMGKGTLR
jgi:hypothetical protein